MKVVSTLSKITNIITKTFAIIAALALLFNVVIIIANIIMRAFFDSAIIGTEEYISMSEIVLIFLALGYTQYKGGLVHVAFFMKKLPKLGPVIAWAFHQWAASVIIALMVWQTCVKIPTVKQVTTALLLPYKPFYIVLAVGAAVYLIATVYEAIKATIAIFNEEVRKDVVANLPA